MGIPLPASGWPNLTRGLERPFSHGRHPGDDYRRYRAAPGTSWVAPASPECYSKPPYSRSDSGSSRGGRMSRVSTREAKRTDRPTQPTCTSCRRSAGAADHPPQPVRDPRCMCEARMSPAAATAGNTGRHRRRRGIPTASSTTRSRSRPRRSRSPTTRPSSRAPCAIYNWADYLYKKVTRPSPRQSTASRSSHHLQQHGGGIQKMVAGQVAGRRVLPDDRLRLPLSWTSDLLQPLNHELIPNMEANCWPTFWDPGPYYDRSGGTRFPYTIYTTGVAYRRDRISDDEAGARRGRSSSGTPSFRARSASTTRTRDAIADGAAPQRGHRH